MKEDKSRDKTKNRETENDIKESEDFEEKKQGIAKKASVAVFLLVILLFVAVVFFEDFVTAKMGKAAGTIALIAVAAVISILLYRKEIIRWFKNLKK